MAGTPPPWVITDGDDSGGGGGRPTETTDSTSDSLTPYQERYGVGGSSSGGGGPPPSIDISAFLPNYTETDKGLAWFRLVLSCFFLVLGTYSLFRFYRSRWILDIRTRSARLVMLGGIAVVASYLAALNDAILIIWGPDSALRWFWSSLLLFFITPNLFGSYICRALRLAVVFHPRAKRALPWLIPERNYLYFLLLMGLGFLAIPLHHEYTLEVWEIVPKQTDILATVSLVFAGLLFCLYPFIRKVDDLFNISTELVVVGVMLIVLAVGQKLTWQFGGTYEIRWIGNNIIFVISAFVFGASVVDPLRRLAFDPLAASKRDYANRVLLNRRKARSTARTASSGISDSEDEGRASRAEEGRGTTSRPTSLAGGGGGEFLFYATNPFAPAAIAAAVPPRMEEDVWDFERLASTPLLAVAFEDFSRKALCHESVLFLSEVSRYQNDDYSEPSGGPGPTQYEAFCRITDTFVKAGSREEVNLSDADKKRIVNWSHKGNAWFDKEDEEERRLVFGQAYAEVKDMLEANLLRRFLQTEQFKSVKAQRENITIMMISPPKS